MDIFGYEVDLRVASDEFPSRRVGRRKGQREARAAIRRCDLDPPASRFEAVIHHQPKTKLVEVETQASFLIANEDHDEMQAEIRVLPIQTQKGPVNPKRYSGTAHSQDYTFGRAFEEGCEWSPSRKRTGDSIRRSSKGRDALSCSPRIQRLDLAFGDEDRVRG